MATPEFEIIALTPAAWPDFLEESATAQSAARAGGTGVFDLQFVDDAEKIAQVLATAIKNLPSGKFGIRCSATQIASLKPVIRILSEKSKTGLIIFHFADGIPDKNSCSKTIAALHKENLRVFFEVISKQEAELAEASGCDGLIAKGHESAGRVGEETGFVLFQRIKSSTSLPVFVQGGVGLHTASAAYVGGATGVVLDSQLLLFPESGLGPEQIDKISQFDGTETTLVSALPGEYFRIWSKAGSSELSELKELGENENGSDSRLKLLVSLNEELRRRKTFPALLPIGQDIALAETLVRHFGTTGAAITGLQESVKRNAALAASAKPLAPDSPLALSHKTRYPILQGAMTRVSDTAQFALDVANGGALPFLALALMRKDEIEPLLAETKEKLNGQSWGVGILGFVPQELRNEQLEAIEKHRPPFALIAGGRPDQAKQLESLGIQTYLHVPSPLLLQSFIEMGSKRFIFEGKECGGHVGPRSSFVLWDNMIEALLRSIGPKEKASDFHVIFAGGIHDSFSAALVSGLAAPLVARGVRIGVLMGTAYLFTDEAVKSGAIVKKFQNAALECSNTVLLETGPGHAIRCIDSPYKESFDKQRKELEQQCGDRNEVRQELEMMNLGRLRIASKGLARDASGNRKGLANVSEDQQWSDGMYMIGQVAALHNKTTTIEQLHEDVSLKSSLYLKNFEPQIESLLDLSCPRDEEPIAIIGMSCLFPKANNLETFWENILSGLDCIEEVPQGHWDWRKLYNEDPLARDKIYSKWGGFLQDVPFDPSQYGIPPSSLASVDPMQLLILEVTRAALSDAGYSTKPFNKERTSIVLANAGHGPITAFYSLRSMLDTTMGDLDPEYRKKLESRLPEWTEDSFPGYLGNVVAGRVANRFDFGGINFCVDAACASSLAALYVGIKELRSKSSDIVLLASTDTHNQPGDYLSFSKTHALSPRGRCRTFDASADGIVISEGMAVLMLKRLSDAERDGDRIYALIRGIGGSSDGRDLSLTAPRPAGQMLALKRAYEDAGVSPSTVELIEAHGTGTVAGDKAEIEALNKVFESSGAQKSSCAIGSVKTMIGHTKCSAGLASVIKVAKSLYHKVLPPTLGVTVPNPSCNFETSPFYINSETRSWIKPEDGAEPRRAGISAFGFGGTNFHTVLEEYNRQSSPAEQASFRYFPTELFVFRSPDKDTLLKTLSAMQDTAQQLIAASKNPRGPIESSYKQSFVDLAYRTYLNTLNSLKPVVGKEEILLSIVAKSPEDLLTKLDTCKQQLTDNAEAKIRDPRGIFCAQNKNQKLPIAFLFPGQGSQQVNMLRDLSLSFKEIRNTFGKADHLLNGCFEQSLSRYVYANPVFSDSDRSAQHKALTNTHVAQPAVAVADMAAFKILDSFGVKPSMAAGHSFGEYAALAACGGMTEEELYIAAENRGRIFAAGNGANEGSMLAVAAPSEIVQELIAGLPQVTLANINSPKQCIISGNKQTLAEASNILTNKGLAVQPIAVSAAFHSPLMEPVKEKLHQALSGIRFQTPKLTLYSNTHAKPYSTDAGTITNLLSEHAVKPVLFQKEVEAMYAAGARIFIECGPGSILSNLVGDILADKEHLVLPLERNGKHGVTQLQTLLGQLFVCGAGLNLGRLFKHRVEPAIYSQHNAPIGKGKLAYLLNSAYVKKLDGTILKQPETSATRTISSTNTPITPVAPSIGTSSGSSSSATGSREKLLLEFQNNMLQMTRNFIESQERVMLAYLQGSGDGVIPSFNLPITPDFNLPKFPATTNNETVTTIIPSKAENSSLLLKSSESTATPVTEQETSSNQQDPETLIRSLIEIVSERTGYPHEMLDPALDMEADLGIDSIKRVEILNNFRKLLPESLQSNLEGSVEKLAGTKTLQGIIDWIRTDLNSEPVAVSSADAQEPIHNNGPDLNRGDISRSVVRLRELRTPSSKLAPGIYVITDDGKGYAQALADLLGKQGSTPIVVQHSALASNNSQPNKFTADILNSEQILSLLEKIEAQFGTVSGFIHLLPLSEEPLIGMKTEKHPYLSVRSTFTVSKALQKWLSQPVKENTRPFSFFAATALGGDFASAGGSPDFNPIIGGVSGIQKTNGREHPNASIRTIDFVANIQPKEAAAILCTELGDTSQLLEVAYKNGQRHELYVETSAEIESGQKIHLTSSSVILVTGGARGITAEICSGLATKFKPTFVIVGRGTRPQQEEAAEFRNLTSPRELKAAIMESMRQDGKNISVPAVEAIYQSLLKEREIRTNLQRIESTGAKVKYYPVDVRNEAEFAKIIHRIYDTFGKIDGVIHGAGIIEDALLKDKTLESFDRVFCTKIDSAITLSKNLQLDSLQFLIFFSSVVARTGNAGQSDYSAANEVLNKLAASLQKGVPGRVASIMWGPWRGGMAQTALEPVFARYGWAMIEPEEGYRSFERELLNGSEDVEVLLVGQLPQSTKPKAPQNEARELISLLGSANTAQLQTVPIGARIHKAQVIDASPNKASFLLRLDPQFDLYLNDHALDGIPVLPMAMALELMAEAAQSLHPDWHLNSISNLDIPAGIMFEVGSKDLLITAHERPSEGDSALIDLSLSTKAMPARKNFRALASMTKERASILPKHITLPSVFSVPNLHGALNKLPESKELYQKWLFHGPLFQGIVKLLGLGANGAVGDLITFKTSDCLKESNGESWLIDPVLLDSAMQLAGVWARNYLDITALPTGFKSIHRIAEPDGDQFKAIVSIPEESKGSELICDLAIYDANGKMFIYMERLSGVGSKALNRLTGQQTTSKAVR